jgi:hypothetical protein
MRRHGTALLSSLVLLVATAFPAFAQEGFGGDAESCAAAVEALDDSLLAPISDDLPRPTLEELLDRGLTPDEICTIYGADVLPDVQELQLLGPLAGCQADIPYLQFQAPIDTDEIELSFVEVGAEGEYEGVDEDGETVTGAIRDTRTVDLTGDPLEVYSLLWPGMELNADGRPIRWPNWEPVFADPNDDTSDIVTWEQVDDGFDWARTQVRGELGVFASFNPETALYYVTYPPPDTECADPPEVEVAGITITRPGAQPAEVLGVSLARTGADVLLLAVLGAGILALGVVAVRRPRRGAGA